jgi:hypothetical protein
MGSGPRTAGIGLFLLVASIGRAQNLVSGGTFDTSLEAFHHDPSSNGTSAWSSLDAAGSPTSGSALLTSTNATAGAPVTLLTTCVPVAAGQQYTLSADARFSEGETSTGGAELAISWTPGTACQGFLSGNAFLIPVASRGSWIHGSNPFTAPAGANTALVVVAIDKIEPGETLSAKIDNVVLGLTSAPAEELVGYIAVAGSLPGNFGSFFRTSLQIMNPHATPISGHFVFHRGGVSGSPSDPTLGYSLAPGQTFALYDAVAAMGLSGLGSFDVFASDGNVPVVLARIFNDAGAGGTTGFTETLAPRIFAFPGTSYTGYLLCPAILDLYRYNVGLRTAGAPVTVTAVVLDPAGTEVHSVTRTYPADYFVQTTVTDFLGGFQIGDASSLRVTFTGGSLILYGATVDNTTQDPSAEFMQALQVAGP